MSFKYNFGDGRLGSAEISDGFYSNLNSYARVTSINKNIITIDAENMYTGEISKFAAGETVLIHVSATNGTDADLLGKYQLAEIQLIVGNTLTLDQKIFDIDLNYFYVQIVSVPQFKNLTLKNAELSPQPYNPFSNHGGLLVFQVFDNFTMINSNINLVECGIPANRKNSLRPVTETELRGETDQSLYAGTENYLTATRLMMNAGDGVCFIQAKNFIADSESRIGNPKTQGRKKCRGAADSKFRPSNVTNIGGSTILIAAGVFKEIGDKIQGTGDNSVSRSPDFLFPILAKYRSSTLREGRGLCRCYIASNTILPDDEKLYSFDTLADESRVQKLGVEDFGNGFLGEWRIQITGDRRQETVGSSAVLYPASCPLEINNYAAVTEFFGNRIYYGKKTLSGIAPLRKGALVIVQDILTGKFTVSRVLEYDESFITIKNKFVAEKAQIITVAEYSNILIENFAQVRKFDGEIGGVLAIAANDTLTIEGEINAKVVESENVGNSQSWERLQIGGMFLLGKKIIFGESARLVGDTMIIGGSLEGFESVKTLGGNNFVYEGE